MIALNFRDRSFSELGGRLWLEQSAPYGWLVVQRAVLLTLGSSEVALRLVPTLFGIATYVTALLIARRWLTWPAGLIFVLMCIFGHALSHYRVEVKHYTGDAFWALLLPALAVWATEGATTDDRRRRMATWWMVAAAGLWLANGALLVAPACALLILAISAETRRRTRRVEAGRVGAHLVRLIRPALLDRASPHRAPPRVLGRGVSAAGSRLAGDTPMVRRPARSPRDRHRRQRCRRDRLGARGVRVRVERADSSGTRLRRGCGIRLRVRDAAARAAVRPLCALDGSRALRGHRARRSTAPCGPRAMRRATGTGCGVAGRWPLRVRRSCAAPAFSSGAPDAFTWSAPPRSRGSTTGRPCRG